MTSLLTRRARGLMCGLLASTAAAGSVLAQDTRLGSSVQGLLAYARAQSPELGAMRQEADAAAQRVGAAGALPDPVLRVELMNINNYGSTASPSLLPSRVGETKYTLMQTLPLWGKRDLRRDVAAADATQAAARADVTWAERVAVLTDSLASTDSPAAHAGYARHRAQLLRQGVELYELRPASGVPHKSQHRWRHVSSFSLHAKIVVQDRARAIVGSLNQDPRSRLHNTEAWIVLEGPELAEELAALFEEGTALEHAFKVEANSEGLEALAWRTEEDGKSVRYDIEPMTGFWMRLWRGILGVVIPEHLL